MSHKVVDYLVCAELKCSIKRAHIRQGLKNTDNSYKALLSFLRGAARQAARQAFVAMKRPDVANSNVILIAASGPFWMWCLASRSDLFRKFSNTVMEDLLDEAKAERDKDSAKEESDILGDDDDGLEGDNGSYTPASFDTILSQNVFQQHPALPSGWSNVVMLDTKESEIELHAIVKTLINVINRSSSQG